jgi:hypothetical protein
MNKRTLPSWFISFALLAGVIGSALAQKGVGSSPLSTLRQGLIAYWDLDEASGNRAAAFQTANLTLTDTTLTVVQASTFGTPSTGTWYFLVAHHDSVNNQIGISVNNGTTDTTATTGGVRDGTAPFRVGAFGNATSPFDGRIDAVMIWKRLLTAAEKAYLYDSGNGRSPFGADWASLLILLWISPEIVRCARRTRSGR